MSGQRDFRADQRKLIGLPPVQATRPQSAREESYEEVYGVPRAGEESYAETFGDGSLSDEQMAALEKGEGGPWNDYADEDGPWKEYSDAETFGARGLTDEEMLALEKGQPPPKPLDDNELGAARALRVAGAGMGWGDEVVGGSAALGEFFTSGFDTKRARAAYEREQKRAEALSQRYEAERPVESVALDVVGGAGPGAALFKTGQGLVRAFTGAKKLGVAGNIGALGLTGAGGAAGYNAGRAPQSVGEKASAAVDPASLLVGGTLGVVAGPLGNTVARGASRIGRVFTSPEQKAARYVAEKLAQSSDTPQSWAARQAEATSTGKPAALADTGPQGARDAAAMAAREPGQGREFAQGVLRARQEGQGARVTQDLQQTSGTSTQGYVSTVDDITARQQAAAKPAYDQAFANKSPIATPKMTEVINRPSAKSALQRGLRIAADEGIDESELVIRDAAGNITGVTTKGADFVKRGLDDMIESAQRTGDNQAARALTMLKKQLLDEVDRVNPAYAKARQTFAGHAANKRALEQGRKAHTSHPDQIKADMDGLTPGEREAYKTGFVQRVVEEVENAPDGADAVRRIFGNPAKRARLKSILGDERFAQLEKRLAVEAQMSETNKAARLGSQTAERMGASDDFREFMVGSSPEIASGAMQAFVTGRIGPLARAIGWPAIMNLYRGASERTRHQILRMLLSDDPAAVRRALNMIGQEFKKAKTAQAIRDTATGAAAANKDVRAASGAGASVAYNRLWPWAKPEGAASAAAAAQSF